MTHISFKGQWLQKLVCHPELCCRFCTWTNSTPTMSTFPRVCSRTILEKALLSEMVADQCWGYPQLLQKYFVVWWSDIFPKFTSQPPKRPLLVATNPALGTLCKPPLSMVDQSLGWPLQRQHNWALLLWCKPQGCMVHHRQSQRTSWFSPSGPPACAMSEAVVSAQWHVATLL